MKEKHGGETAATEAIKRATGFQKELEAASPFVAGLAKASGANLDPQVLDISSKYGK